MNPRILFFATMLTLTCNLYCNTINAQGSLNDHNPNFNTNHSEEKTLFYKHEIGFSIGAFPTIGAVNTPDKGYIFDDEPFKQTYLIERSDGQYIKMYHFGSYTFNYNYHVNLKHSIGASLSWVGKHVDKYWIYNKPSGSTFSGMSFFSSDYGPPDTVNGSGWKHFFTLQINYRKTYFHRNKTSLYWGIHYGVTFGVRDKDILPKKTHHFFLGSESNIRHYWAVAMQLTPFGIELGEKYVYYFELGVGTQGLIKTGFRYKF